MDPSTAYSVNAIGPSQGCVLLAADSSTAETEKIDGRAVRRSLNATGRYVRQPTKDEKSQALMEDHGVGYSLSGLVAQMREQNNAWQQGDVTIKLAKAYGYCWGVERAVRMAYEARNASPDKKLYITNEIIHNPEVNQVGSKQRVLQLKDVPMCLPASRSAAAVPCSGSHMGDLWSPATVYAAVQSNYHCTPVQWHMAWCLLLLLANHPAQISHGR